MELVRAAYRIRVTRHRGRPDRVVRLGLAGPWAVDRRGASGNHPDAR